MLVSILRLIKHLRQTELKNYIVFENFKWILMLGIFLGGLSLHVSQALLAHMFEINMVRISLNNDLMLRKPLVLIQQPDMGSDVQRSRVLKLFH